MVLLWFKFLPTNDLKRTSLVFAFKKSGRSEKSAACFTGIATQSAITCSKLTIETLEQGVKYIQS